MPYMYCNHSGCNETVQVPNKYCAKHVVKLDTDKVVKQLLAEKEPTSKTKKTTK